MPDRRASLAGLSGVLSFPAQPTRQTILDDAGAIDDEFFICPLTGEDGIVQKSSRKYRRGEPHSLKSRHDAIYSCRR